MEAYVCALWLLVTVAAVSGSRIPGLSARLAGLDSSDNNYRRVRSSRRENRPSSDQRGQEPVRMFDGKFVCYFCGVFRFLFNGPQ